jgi:hypothetical protein
METSKPIEYLPNKQFTAEVSEWIYKCRAAKESELERPMIPDSVAGGIILIARRLATKWKFAGYSWKEEFIGDAIEVMIRYADRFNPEKSSNAFAYFTQIAFNAFRARITHEKKQIYVKQKIAQQSSIDHMYGAQNQDDDVEYHNQFVEMIAESSDPDLERLFEPKKAENQKPKSKYDVESLY